MAGLVKTENVTNSREVEKARIILIGLGILPSKKGFNYMADCIYLFSEGNKSLHAVQTNGEQTDIFYPIPKTFLSF